MPLSLDNVSYTYAEGESLAQLALASVTLTAEPGEIVLVAGSTGSGKSTLLRLAAGLLTPGEGSATVDGLDLAPATARGIVGLVFQNPEQQLFADTVLDDVAFGPRNLGMPAERVSEVSRRALAGVGLDPDIIGGRSPFALSGGQARRAAIAGVLAMEPRYLLLDEPTAGLDAAGRADLHRLILAARSRSAVVVVSHDLDEMLPLADKVLILSDARSLFWGSAAELVADPSMLEGAGLDVPALLAVQVLAAKAGWLAGPYTLDPEEAATRLLAASARGFDEGSAS